MTNRMGIFNILLMLQWLRLKSRFHTMTSFNRLN